MKAQPPQAQPASPLDALDQHRATLTGQYKQLQQAQVKGLAMEQVLSKLEQLGEAVTNADVVKEVGKLVGSGMVGAREIAVALTDMPQSGPALAEWISQHMKLGAIALKHTEILKNEAQRQLLNASFTGLMAHAGAAAQQAPGPQEQASPGPGLTPESPVEGTS